LLLQREMKGRVPSNDLFRDSGLSSLVMYA
jgi:hypothetical protein